MLSLGCVGFILAELGIGGLIKLKEMKLIFFENCRISFPRVKRIDADSSLLVYVFVKAGCFGEGCYTTTDYFADE